MDRRVLIIGGVAVALAIVLLVTVFRAKPADPRIDELNGKIEVYQQQIEQLQQKQAAYDSTLQLLQEQYQANRKTETIIKHHYDKIPVNTPSDKPGLRREFADY
jgi:Tfp pilus assembly protein PilN